MVELERDKDRRTSRPAKDLLEVLPASLESSKLYMYDDWSINGWAPDLSSLFERN
jgi:hypothetical protein